MSSENKKITTLGKCDQGFPEGVIGDGECVWTFYEAENPYREGTSRHEDFVPVEEFVRRINMGEHSAGQRVEIVRVLPFYYFNNGQRTELFLTLVGKLK